MNPLQYRDNVLDPVLKTIGLYSASASKLMMLTAAHESHFEYIRQIKGPARGLFQMEFPTYTDLVEQLSARHPDKIAWLDRFKPPQINPLEALAICLPFQVVACRLQYWRFPEPLPDDWEGMWDYYKAFWNTPEGKATREEFFNNAKRYKIKEMYHGNDTEVS